MREHGINLSVVQVRKKVTRMNQSSPRESYIYYMRRELIIKTSIHVWHTIILYTSFQLKSNLHFGWPLERADIEKARSGYQVKPQFPDS